MDTLPPALRKQAAEAEALMATLAAQTQAQPQVARDTSQIVLPPAPPPAPAAQEVTPPAPPPPAPPTDNFEAKYRTLQGKYSAEVPRFQQQIANMQRELDALRAQNAPKPAEQPPEPPKPAASPKEIEAFGAEMIEMVRGQAEQMFRHQSHALAGQLQAFDGRLKALEQAVTGVTQAAGQTREELFFGELNRSVPDWRDINGSDAWLEWLSVADPIYRVPRQAALDAARERLDGAAAVAIFQAFKADQPAPAPSSAPQLQAQVAPPAGAASPQPSAPVTQIITQAAINQFYRDLTRGTYKGREQEAAAMEAAINQAAAEGRIR